eukprot:TRINITY_DN773158_c0_g1_i1.p1 TRINITY_DN773158_c0_g1~~TRINITY_DN773158_c0_g1_i1.p1  ORF type:complete len:889 (-),score=257.70 TRINITY_DN773158_c0_g1_i1:382-3048(-)
MASSLTLDQIKAGLSTLGQSPVDLSLAFLSLSVIDKGVEDISKAADLIHLHEINLSKNSIKDLSPLENIPFLSILDASKNEIEEVLDFAAAKCDRTHPFSSGEGRVGSTLQIVNLSQNKIKEIRDLSKHRFLEELYLAHNHIVNISGLQNLEGLRVLDLSNNAIETITGLTGLKLTHLNLANNSIRITEPLKELTQLRELTLDGNKIEELKGLEGCKSLIKISAKDNLMESVHDLRFLENLLHLRDVDIVGNPFMNKEFSQWRILKNIPRLTIICGEEIQSDDKIKAANLQGAELKQREDHFLKHLPDQHFEDLLPPFVESKRVPISQRLKEHSTLKKSGPVLCIVMDGVGIGHEDDYDAVHKAHTPTLDQLREDHGRFTTIQAHGKAVGLPSNGDMGNSEVGHNALGSGRVLKQGASLVDSALEGPLFESQGWSYLKESFARSSENNETDMTKGTLHLIGLLSDGGVHSRFDQLVKIMHGAVKDGCERIRLHILLDGRDVPDRTSPQYVRMLEDELKELRKQGVDAKVASGGGRMLVTMDRYNADWAMVERGWKAHVLGQAPREFGNALEAVNTLLKEDKKVSDQFLPAFVITDEDNSPIGTIEDGDAVLCFNFRGDRMLEISQAFESDSTFSEFDRQRVPRVNFAGMMIYDGDLHCPANFLVGSPVIDQPASEWLANNGVRTFACSETQKFGHVTYFWNGNRSGYFNKDLETFIEIPSDNVCFDETPRMKADLIAQETIAALASGKYDFLRINLANGDMVGHTGNLKATIEAMECVDECVGLMINEVFKQNGRFLLLADHGNADDMAQRTKKGEVIMEDDGVTVKAKTSHTLAPVPFAIGGDLPDNVIINKDINGGLANVTATFLNLLGFQAPEDWEPSLLEVKEK